MIFRRMVNSLAPRSFAASSIARQNLSGANTLSLPQMAGRSDMREQQRPEAKLNTQQHKQTSSEIAITISGDIITTNSIP